MSIHQRAYVPLQWAESLDQMLALTDDRVKEYGAPAHLVGFSMGGYVALEYTLANPDKVASLTLIGYNADGLSKNEIASRNNIVSLIEKGMYKGSSESYLQPYLHPSNQDNTKLVSYLASMNDDLGNGVLKAHIKAATPRPSRLKELTNLDVPVHIVAASHDLIAPLNTLEHMHTIAKDSTLSVIEHCGHMMLVEAPDKSAKAIEDFLAQRNQ